MADVMNLRRARKDRARRAQKRAADQNAARHGESRAARALRSEEAAAQRRRLDELRREVPGEGPADETTGDLRGKT